MLVGPPCFTQHLDQQTQFRSLVWEDPLEAEMATSSNSCQENPMDRGAWRTLVHGVAKSQTQLSTVPPLDQQALSISGLRVVHSKHKCFCLN